MQNQSTSNAQRNARVRQHPLGSYVADFACLAPKLIVELDGSQHLGQAAYDQRRDAYFREHGYEVLRFPSNAPLLNFDGVRIAILEQLKVLGRAAPTPTLPQRGRE